MDETIRNTGHNGRRSYDAGWNGSSSSLERGLQYNDSDSIGGGIVTSRDETIIDHMGIASAIACRMRKGVGVDLDDCKGVAYEALVKAVDGYDESKGNISLATYIDRKVEFALLDHSREKFGRPTKWTGKIAKRNQETKDGLCRPGNIDNFKNDLSVSMNGTEKKVCDKDMASKILAYIKNIKYSSHGKNRKGDTAKIFKLYFMEDLPMGAVAKKQNITEARVSQIIQDTIIRCKKHFRQEATA